MDQEKKQTESRKFKTSCVACLVMISTLFTVSVTADQLQDDFASGLEALENDRLKTAREIFHGILNGSPSLHRARLELAKAYFMSMDFEQARKQAQMVLDDPNTPASVRATVLAFVAQIDKDEKSRAEKHKWTPSIYLGLMYDTNVNVGPENELLLSTTNGLASFTVDQDSLERDDAAIVITPGITHTYNPDKRFEFGEHSGYMLWQSQGSYYHRDYFSEDEFNLGILHGGTGPVWVVPRHWRAGINLSLDQIWYGGSPLALYSNISPNITWQLGDNTEFSLAATIGRRDYNKSSDSVREGIFRSFGASLGQYMNDKKVAVKIGGRVFDFDADSERFSNNGWEAFIGGVVKAWPNGSVYARAGYQSFDFDGLGVGGIDALTNESTRDDEESRYTIGFQHDFRSGMLNNWTLSGSVVRLENESNIPIVDYDRNQVNLGLSRSF